MQIQRVQVSVILDQIGLRVAGLELWLEAGASQIGMAVPICHIPFLADRVTGEGLTLHVRDGPLSRADGWLSVYYDDETWQLWRDGAGRHVFVAPKGSPPRRQVFVDTGFRAGEVVGEFNASAAEGRPMYPLQDIDMVLYANWLAVTGGLIMHAAGVDDGGRGYAFVGPSGAGKSTLAAGLVCESGGGVVPLGEDQVIVRYHEGCFRVYGTPWHTDPALCSPGGAPLAKLFFLDRSVPHGVARCTPSDGVARLLQTAFIPYYDRAAVARILDRLALLGEQVPFYTLSYQLMTDVLPLIRDA